MGNPKPARKLRNAHAPSARPQRPRPKPQQAARAPESAIRSPAPSAPPPAAGALLPAPAPSLAAGPQALSVEPAAPPPDAADIEPVLGARIRSLLPPAEAAAIDSASSPSSVAPSPRRTFALQVKFLSLFSRTGSLRKAAAASGISIGQHYAWMHAPAYAAAYDEVREVLADELESSVYARATKGVRKAIVSKGEIIGHDYVPSDLLAMFLLKAMRPERYREYSQVQRVDSDIKRLSKILGISPDELARTLRGSAAPAAPVQQLPAAGGA